MPKRPEISIKEFEQNIGLKAMAVIDFDIETFGQAANNGQMIEEMNAKSVAAVTFRSIAMAVTNRRDMKPELKSKGTSALKPLFDKLLKRSAAAKP